MSLGAGLTAVGLATKAGRRQVDTPFALDNGRAKQRSDVARRRMVDVLSQFMGMTMGLQEMDFGILAASSSKEELKEWDKQTNTCVYALQKIHFRLKEQIERKDP